MKDQYFADKRDFFKYDLLLHLMGCGLGFEQLLMAWWLTPDDQSSDGEVRDYPVSTRSQVLHDWLQAQHHRQHRRVSRLADFDGIKHAAWTYAQVLEYVPDDPDSRAAYVDTVAGLAGSPPGVVFLDPDNGMMAGKVSRSRRCKYVDYPEVRRLVAAMHPESLLVVFQYLPRVARTTFYPAALELLRSRGGVENVTWVSPDNLVAYFLITKNALRLAEVRGALEPYVVRHCFHFEGDGAW